MFLGDCGVHVHEGCTHDITVKRMNASSLSEQAALVLEWPRLLEVLAGHAHSPMGAERCRTLPLETTLEAGMTRLRETAEMVAMRESADPFPSIMFPDLRGVFGRGAKGAILESYELRDVSIVIGIFCDVIRYLSRQRDTAPMLWEVVSLLSETAEFRQLKETIDRGIDADGNMKESATPELRRVSQQAHGLKQQMRRRLEAILVSSRYADVLQERYFDQREGRYVVPLKADMRSKIPGIVHDVSSSGATVFVEPRELVELNNAIKVAELEVTREIRRILQELSGAVSGQAEVLSSALEALAELDCMAAKAALSQQIKGRPVSLNPRGRIALRQARHPLLVLAKDQVIANDLILDETTHVLIISGPNTGGKTVTLKILGLFALMVRSGLPLPCADGSEMGWFPELFADIGDTQDLSKDLSSFSAHITQMIRLLNQATRGSLDREPALVLLDEPVTSTDPVEGAALAEALLLRLADLGMKVVVTTHYNSLKILAQTTPGFMNASVGFDIQTLSPTYRVMMGVPGGSSAIEIAGRLGMDESILDDALARVHREDRALERMLTDLQDKQGRLDDERAHIAIVKEQTERAAREAAEVADRLTSTEREERARMKKKWSEELGRARAQVQSIIETLKADQTFLKTREAKQGLGELDERLRQTLISSEERIPLEHLRVGDRVEIAGLGSIGTLLETPQGKKRIRLRVGETEMSVAASLLVASHDTPKTNVSPDVPRLVLPRSAEEPSTALDLRGKNADEAIDLTLSALDRAILGGSPRLHIIHGHGTGRLKTALRAYLQDSPYVSTFRPGDRSEGGDGVTIVDLK